MKFKITHKPTGKIILIERAGSPEPETKPIFSIVSDSYIGQAKAEFGDTSSAFTFFFDTYRQQFRSTNRYSNDFEYCDRECRKAYAYALRMTKLRAFL